MRFFLNIFRIGGKPLKKLILLNVLMFFVITLFSMSAKEHELFTFGIIGWVVPKSTSESHIKDFNRTFDIQMEFSEELSSALKGSGVEGDHRRFGHWGSGRDVPFEKLTEEMGYKGEYSASAKEAIANFWQNGWDERVKIVERDLGFTGKKAENMMRLEHNLHLLQDYTQTRNKPLQKPMEIFDDFFETVTVLIDDSNEGKKLIENLRKLDNPFESEDFKKLMDELYEVNKDILEKNGITKIMIGEKYLSPFKTQEYTNKLFYNNNLDYFSEIGVDESDFLNTPTLNKQALREYKSELAKKLNLNEITYKEFKSVLSKNEIAEDMYLKNPDKYKKIINDYKKTYNYKMNVNHGVGSIGKYIIGI